MASGRAAVLLLLPIVLVVAQAFLTKDPFHIGVCGDQDQHALLPYYVSIFYTMQMSNWSFRPWHPRLMDPFSLSFRFFDTMCDYRKGHDSGLATLKLGGSEEVHVVLGCSCSAASDSVARIGTILGIPQISFSSGASFFSTHKVLYKYFMRTTVPSHVKTEIYVSLLQHWEWTKAKFVTLSDPYGDLIEEDYFVETARIAASRGIEIRAIWLDLTAIWSDLAPVNGACADSDHLSVDGRSCFDLAKWRAEIHNSRVFPELIHILYLPEEAFFQIVLQMALDEGLLKHVWIFDTNADDFSAFGRVDNVVDNGIRSIASEIVGSMELKPEPFDTDVWRQFKEFGGNLTPGSKQAGFANCWSPPHYQDGRGPYERSDWRENQCRWRLQEESSWGGAANKAMEQNRTAFFNAREFVDALLTIYIAADDLARQGATVRGCVDSPESLHFAERECYQWVDFGWCTAQGGYGPKWNAEWGTFEDYSVDGHTAATACCDCGGGNKTLKLKGKDLHKAMMTASFDGAMGPVSFNHLGDRVTSNVRYAVENFQGGKPVKVAEFDANGLVMMTGKEVIWPGNTTTKPTGLAPSCSPGSFFDGLGCVRCPPGAGLTIVGASNKLEDLCKPCLPGEYSNIGICQSCGRGTWSSTNATSCTQCAPGRYSGGNRESSCSECDEGRFAKTKGSTACDLCETGRFAGQGADECEECPGPNTMTTQDQGAKALFECVCFAGFFHMCSGDACALGSSSPDAAKFCAPCLVGMACLGRNETPAAMVYSKDNQRFHKPPYLQSGTMAIGATVYNCGKRVDGKNCKGDRDMGSDASVMCAPHSGGVACSECANGYSFTEGECKACGAGGVVGISVIIIGGIIFVFVLFYLTFPTEPIGTFTEVSVETVMHTDVLSNTVAATLNMVQTTWLFAQEASIQWPESARSFLSSGNSGSAWDLSAFGLDCFLGGGPKHYAVARTAILNMLPAFPCSILSLAYIIGKGWRTRAEGRAYFPDHCQACSLGLSVLSAFFLVIANSAINIGFSDFPHPGGQRSLSAFPYLLVTDGEVSVIRGSSIAGIIVWCVVGMTWVAALLIRLPSKISDPGYRRSVMSITSRYRPETPWWFLVQMIQNLLIAMSPSIWEKGEAQLVWMCFVFAIYFFTLISFRPYFCPVVYYCDLICSLGKLLILLLAVPYQCTGEGGLLITFIAAFVYTIALFECLYAAKLWLSYIVRGNRHEISKEWRNLGGRLQEALKLPYTGATMDVVRPRPDGGQGAGQDEVEDVVAPGPAPAEEPAPAPANESVGSASAPPELSTLDGAAPVSSAPAPASGSTDASSSSPEPSANEERLGHGLKVSL